MYFQYNGTKPCTLVHGRRQPLTYHKVKSNQKLNIIEGMLIERLLTKYNGLSLMSVEEHLNFIYKNCEDVESVSQKEKQKVNEFYKSYQV